ncbi:MAG: FKBP-type peptidyl-prolyl cis-trans isomerase [Bacteroidales bacterium]|nr:FKBP-type peptidyl-prolyl cis-trans isomerase [Bacteroidales bacterium]MDD2426139.1 FKBP-type peptidyl-prolyl cis-trans isomerase [Bacteroidales bacterium]MDD3989470.1 FKBP-type peptidyl-prolyl cis-trans isomerase [Bacteroidales bacterium]
MKTKNLLYRSVLLIVASSFVLTSCLGESDYEKQVKIDDQIISDYLAENDIQAQKHSSGLYYQTLTTNSSGATLKKNDVVSFYYTISRLDGTVIEEIDKAEDEPVKFKLLTYTIIPEGLDKGIDLMRVGEKFRFYIPSYLAYGSYSSGDFSTNCNFIVDVEVTDVESETEINTAQLDSIETYMADKYPDHLLIGSGLYFVDSIPGTGNIPMSGNRVNVDFERRYLNNSLIKNVTNTSFYLDRGEAVQGLEDGLKQMREGGVGILIMPASLGFKQSLCVIPQKTRQDLLDDKVISSEVLPYSIIKYIVKLNSIY